MGVETLRAGDGPVALSIDRSTFLSRCYMGSIIGVSSYRKGSYKGSTSNPSLGFYEGSPKFLQRAIVSCSLRASLPLRVLL